MKSFLGELKRRNVFKVGISYAIISWVLLQLIDIILPIFEAPNWISQTLIFVLIIGFPVAIFLAWAYELTPEGIKSDEEAKQYNQANNDRDLPLVSEHKEIQKNSVAILPFKNISSDSEQEYFADGLTDELILRLSKIRELCVKGNTSSFYLKNTGKSFDEIVNILGVAFILEGSVRKQGNKVRIITQLVSGEDGHCLWSQTYEREIADIFSIQNEISESVASSLKITLGINKQNEMGETKNIDAYDAYLRARATSKFYTSDAIYKSIEYINEALMLDPKFGKAWILSMTLYDHAELALPAEETAGFQERANDAFTRANLLCPDMPEVMIADAVKLKLKGKWKDAEAKFKKIIDKYGHSNEEVNRQYGVFLLESGRQWEALVFLERAKNLEPLSAYSTYELAQGLLITGHYKDSLEEVRRGLALGGLEFSFYSIRWNIALLENDKAKCIDIMRAAMDRIQSLHADIPEIKTLQRISDIFALEESDDIILEELNRLANDAHLSRLSQRTLAVCAAYLGFNDMALTLRKQQGYFNSGIWMDIFRDMRKLPEFKQFIREIGLYDYWTKTGNWGAFCKPADDTDFEC